MNLENVLLSKNRVKDSLSRKVKDLPTLPVVALKLLKLTGDQSTSAEGLRRVIETDPAITSKVLRMVNSAAFGLVKKISSIRHAIVLLGFTEIRTIALDVCLFEQIIKKRKSSKFNRAHFWQHCLTVAAMGRIIAEKIGYEDPEEVYVAGLLHDIGKIISDVYGKVSYSEILQAFEGQDSILLEIEKQLSGISHDDIGAYFCAEWGLPVNVVLAIKYHNTRFAHLQLDKNDHTLIAIIALANFISWILGLGSVKICHHSILQPEVEELIDLAGLDLQAIINQVNHEVKDIAEFYDFTFPTPDQFRENLLAVNLQLSRVNTKYYYLQDELHKKFKTLGQVKKSLLQPHRSLNPGEIIPATLQAIHDDFEYERIYFFKIDREKRCLNIMDFFNNTDQEIELSATVVQISHNVGGFIKCLRHNAPFVLSGMTKGESKVLDALHVKEMGIVPVSNNNKIIGILGVDNIKNDKPINLEELTTLTIVASELGMALENARIFDELKNLAYMDSLTKVHNRAYLDKILIENFQKAQNNQLSLSLGMVDVDCFKNFNDTFGHQTGDLVLKLLASTMRKFSRPTDVIGRYGGEEFIFILVNSTLADTVRYAERLRKEVAKLGVLLQKRFPGRPLTISTGVAAYNENHLIVDEIISEADQALYKAKNSGRNKVMAYGDDGIG